MSSIRKPFSFGSMVAVLLAGGVLLSEGLGWSAQNKGSGQSAPSTPRTPPIGNRSVSNTPVELGLGGVDYLGTTLPMAMGGVERQPGFLPPFTEKELVKLVKHHKKNLSKVVPSLEARGLAFDLTPEIEAELRKAGADENFIAGLKSYTPSARARVSVDVLVAESGATAGEAKAYSRLKFEKDPDKRIQDANAFVQRFPKSALLSYVYAIQAAAYWEKNEASNVVNYCEKSLAVNAHNLMALLLVSSALPQPRMLMNVSYAEKEKRLNLAESYATKALQQLDQMGKEQMASGVYASLGMVHLERSRMAGQQPDVEELGKAEQSYKTAIEKSEGSESAVDYFRLGEIYSMENKFDEAISAFSHAKRLAPGSVIGQRADRDIQRLKEKSQAEVP